MTKAKLIDRLELTRQKFNREVQPEEAAEEHYGVSTCPMCEKLSLVHESGCAHCPSCGWSACG